MKNLTDSQKTLLLEISTETMALRLSNLQRFGTNSLEAVVPYAPAKWLGHQPTKAEAQRISRACVMFERLGWLVRIVRGTGNRTIRVEVTEAGHAVAERIASEAVDA